MPVSTPVHISHCIQHILQLNPRSVLDVGCGFGMWGHLCRIYLDAFQEHVQPEDWEVRIDGVEYFEPYILDHQRALYDNIIIGDIRDLVDGLGEYDLIICGDVIEHLDKDDGHMTLDKLFPKAKGALLLNIPIGDGWEHGVVHDNPAEEHLSEWAVEDFERFAPQMKLYQLMNGKYGVFYCATDTTLDGRTEQLLRCADDLSQRGNVKDALPIVQRAIALNNDCTNALYYLVELYYRSNEFAAGNRVLEEWLTSHPEDYATALMLVRASSAQRRYDIALEHLARLLARDDVPADARAQAESLRSEIARNV